MQRLDERIPEKGFPDSSATLDAFLAWTADLGLKLYSHQEEALLELYDGHHVVLDTPTGSGKSLVGTALLFKTFAETGRAWYTAPIKALVSEKFFELCKVFGPENVGMMTGDGAVNRDAPILCCTAEILANLALREGDDAPVDAVVMDEFHYYADRDRGWAWQVPLLTLSKTTFLLMSATLGDTSVIREDLEQRTQRKVAEVRGVQRPVPLEFEYSMKPIHEALASLVTSARTPAYVVHFTQRDATEQAQALMSVDFCSKEEKRAIAEALKGFSFHSPFGPTVKRYVSHGVGLHHAGLLPRYRLLVERLAQQGLLKLICGTDTLGVGINVPIRTVLFTQLCKFDGEKVVILPVREFKQIAGRAGRAGFDRLGTVVVQAPAHVIENSKELATDAKRRKKVVKAQPPTKGYKHWDEEIFRKLVDSPPEPLESRFSLDHGRLLTMMQHAEEVHGDAAPGVAGMLDLIDRCHAPKKAKEEMRAATTSMVADLERAGVLARDGDALHLDPGLQHDFSLHHSLSLFLLNAIGKLDPMSPTHALDVVTWVEAILEHPRPVLQKQVDRAKGEKIAELKAAGVPYEERMEALEDVTWPKPHGEAIYAFFKDYADKHPWVGHEPIRPKSVAREMIERFLSFSEYVKELQLQRVEGVLLRYLSEVYKALVQNVPADHHTDAVLDVIATFRAMLGQVDASLVTEWETLLTGQPVVGEAPHKPDISADPRAFAARVRAELHALVRALAARDWDEAAGTLRPGPDGEEPSAAELEAALAPFLEEHGAVGFDHRARLAANTTITKVGRHQWEVSQRLFPPSGARTEQFRVEGWRDEDEESAWAIEGRVDLSEDTNPSGPLVTWVQLRAG